MSAAIFATLRTARLRLETLPASPDQTAVAVLLEDLKRLLDDHAGALTFDALRDANVPRCVNGFGHALDSWSPAEWTNAMAGEAGEAGEAANVAKKMLRHRDHVAGNRGEDTDLALLREKLGRELADVVIYADLCAASQGIDLGHLVRETFNRKSIEIGAEERL